MSCGAKTRAGRPCGRAPMRGGERCHAHAGERVGRPEKLTEEVERKVCDALRAGNTLTAAAGYAGVSRASLQRWLRLGRAPGAEARYAALAQAARQAEAQGEVHAVGIVRREMAHDVRSAQWMLERRYGWARPSPERPKPPAQDDPPGGGEDVDATDPKTRGLLSALLKRRPHAG